MSQEFDFNFKISTYIINLKERTDRLEHILKQFEGKQEFEITVIDAVKHNIGAVGLWNSVIKAIKIAIQRDDDVIILCEDDHRFTDNYSKDYLFGNILLSHEAGANLLLGGVGGFENAVPISENRWWIDSFWCTQFMIVYKKFFDTMLSEPFADSDTADGKLSEMTSSKMVMVPFISEQEDFGYSDVTKSNNDIKGQILKHFRESSNRLLSIQNAKKRYRAFQPFRPII